MTKRTRRNHGPAFKAKVAVAAIKGEKTRSTVSGALTPLFNGFPGSGCFA